MQADVEVKFNNIPQILPLLPPFVQTNPDHQIFSLTITFTRHPVALSDIAIREYMALITSVTLVESAVIMIFSAWIFAVLPFNKASVALAHIYVQA